MFLIVVVLVLGVSATSHAWLIDFESGLGQDYVNIGTTMPGLDFGTMTYFDILNGAWGNVGNGVDVNVGTPYYIEGYVGAITDNSGAGRIDFINQDGSWFQTGYTSFGSVTLEAYDAFDNLIDSIVGATNTNTYTLDYLNVSSASNNIAYVMVYDTFNYFGLDNISGDASGVPVPEPSTLLLFGTGLVGLGIFRRKFKG